MPHIKTVIIQNLVTKWLPQRNVPLQKRPLTATVNINCHEGYGHKIVPDLKDLFNPVKKIR